MRACAAALREDQKFSSLLLLTAYNHTNLINFINLITLTHIMAAQQQFGALTRETEFMQLM